MPVPVSPKASGAIIFPTLQNDDLWCESEPVSAHFFPLSLHLASVP